MTNPTDTATSPDTVTPTGTVTNTPAAAPDRAERPVTRIGTVVRLVIAAIAMMACAMAAVVPYLIPGVENWARSLEASGNFTALLLFEMARFPLTVLLALGLLLIATRIEKVRLRDYFGHVRAPQAWGALIVTTIAAAVLTSLASGVSHLTGLDAGRASVEEAAAVPLLLMIVYGIARAFVLQGIQEEWWFRGFAFRGLQQHPWFVLIGSTVVFTLLHLLSSGGQTNAAERLLYLVVPLGMGLWAGVERWCTGTVWGAVGVHGGIHTGLILPTMLGWDTGPAAWVAIGVALCVVAVVRLLVSRPWRG